MGIMSFIMRPFVGDQNTGRLAFQRGQGPAFAGINGNGGNFTKRTMSATSNGEITPGPTHKLNDPTATGNENTNTRLQELGDNRSI